MIDDAELIRRYAEGRAEEAFAELVRRHVNFVYACALRRVGGDAHLAEDVTQQVFTKVAREAAMLARREVLSGWLYTTARNASAQVVRTERRRAVREQEAHIMNELTSASAHDAEWERLRPVIDEAMDELREEDREAVLLRFFEGKSFGEIGAKLRLTENTARMRVERALDTLHGRLAQRGVTSTAVALGAVLAGQAGVAAPAGLAGSVTTSVLAASTVTTLAGFGTSGGTILNFMSSAKLGVGTLAAMGVLGASLAGNAWMWWRPPVTHVSLGPDAVVQAATVAAAVPSLALADLGGPDLSVARDRMRAAGVSEAAIRSVLDGVLRRRYRERLSALREARLETAWWQERDFTKIVRGPVRPTAMEDPKLFREMVDEPLERWFGPDPIEVAETDARYVYLPGAVRDELARLEKALALVTAQEVQARYGGTQTALELERARLEAKRQEVIAAFTPEQRIEFEMRHGPLAPSLAQRMELIDGSESEYRAVFALADARVKGQPPMAPKETLALVRGRIDQATADQLVAALGYDRAVDYIWSGAYEFQAYARVVQEAGLAISTPGRMIQLAAETANQASVIHYDAGRTLDQKRAAMVALQQKVQSELDTLLPVAVQQKLAPQSLAWLTGLNEGRYRPVVTTLGGSSGSVLLAIGPSIDKSVSGPWRPVQVLPRRPAGG